MGRRRGPDSEAGAMAIYNILNSDRNAGPGRTGELNGEEMRLKLHGMPILLVNFE